jgi:manganese/zinc/iron transport system permease protein
MPPRRSPGPGEPELIRPGNFTIALQWRDVLEVLLLQRHNTAMVVVAASVLGLAAGVVGCFALLRKRAMMGDTLAHCTLPGICLAFLLATWLGVGGRSLPVLLAGAAISGVAGVLTVHLITLGSRLRDDAAMAVTLSVFFGAGVVLLSYIQSLSTGTQGGLGHFIYGQTAAMQRHDAILIASAAALAVAIGLVFFKELRLVCFDDRFAAAMGLRVPAFDLLMMALVVLVTVIGLQAVGLLLIVAMLIIPPAAARFWTDRFGWMVLLAGGIGGSSGYLGATASALLPRMPAGAVIVLTAGAMFLASMFFAPNRGVLAAAGRRIRLRVRIARDHFLRAVYEQQESGATADLRTIATQRGWSAPTLATVRWLVRTTGLATIRNGNIVLSARGRAEAQRITRNHRLWEAFLVQRADLAASHVDRTADLVEHVLGPELMAELESSLAERAAGIPPSVHPLRSPQS